jgi:hypothetical protein
MIPGLNLALPSLNLGGTATLAQSWDGASFGASGAGDWNVNLAGSGTSLQTSASGLNWLLIAAAAAAWYVLKK